jgi:hypothetical protein
MRFPQKCFFLVPKICSILICWFEIFHMPFFDGCITYWVLTKWNYNSTIVPKNNYSRDLNEWRLISHKWICNWNTILNNNATHRLNQCTQIYIYKIWLKPWFSFSILWCNWSCNHPEGDLAIFCYILDMKVRKKKKFYTLGYILKLIIYNLRFGFFFSKSSKFGPFFHEKSCL